MPNRQPSLVQAFLEKHVLPAEVSASVIATALAFAWLGSGAPHTPLHDLLATDRATLYGTVAAIAGSLLGFVLAAATIILTIAGSRRLARVTGSNQYGAMWGMFLMATKGLGAVTLWALAALVVDRDSSPAPVMFYGLILLSVVAVLQVWTCVWILDQVTRLLVKRPEANADGQD